MNEYCCDMFEWWTRCGKSIKFLVTDRAWILSDYEIFPKGYLKMEMKINYCPFCGEKLKAPEQKMFNRY